MRIKKKLKLFVALAWIGVFLGGCASFTKDIIEASGISETVSNYVQSVRLTNPVAIDFEASETSETTSYSSNTVQNNSDLEELKNYCLGLTYSGEPSVVINNNVPVFSDSELSLTPFQNYSELDSLGRVGTATACVTSDMMMDSDDERQDISDIYPSGFHNAQYDGIDEYGWIYNRCHLLMAKLTNNFDKVNLFTGTRYLNTEGMLPNEIAVSDFLEDYPDIHVMYRVTPVFSGDNLVCNGVILEAYSVEDNGAGLCFCVYCFNVQPGCAIAYGSGYTSGPEYTGN